MKTNKAGWKVGCTIPRSKFSHSSQFARKSSSRQCAENTQKQIARDQLPIASSYTTTVPATMIESAGSQERILFVHMYRI